MKKIVMVLMACLCSICLCSCSFPDIFSSDTDLSSDLTSDTTSGDIDSGSPNHEHTYEWVANENCHQFVYTCGCPTADIAEYHIDYDGNLACDICGYSMGNLPTTANHLLCNQKGAEWIQQLDVKNVAELKIITQAVGVAPGNLKKVSGSNAGPIIARLLEQYQCLETYPISKDKGEICGGQSVTVQFILKDGTMKQLYINNGNYRDSEGNYFELHHTPNFAYGTDHITYYSFISYDDVVAVWLDGVISEPGLICEISIADLEFCILNEDINMGPIDEWYFVNAQFGNLKFLSSRVFYNTNDENRQYYQLVGKDLNELIEEALSNYSVTMNDEAWLWEELKPSYKAGETVSVKIAMALDVGYIFLVNGEHIATCNDVDGLYWEFTFTMPECDVEIDFKTYDGFLPDANYGLLIETYWLQNLDAGSVSVRRYYGEFDSGAIVAMMHVGHFDDVVWSEVVADITFQYYDSDRITVLYDGVFYTLPEAYQYGFISADDLSVIAELHNGNV